MTNISHEHHLHRRKRIHRKHEPYPHPDPLKRFMDRVIYAVSVAGPILTIPQAWAIWASRSAEGVSLVTWSSYIFFSFLWLFYGVLHKEKPIIFSNILWIVVNGFVVIEILVFG